MIEIRCVVRLETSTALDLLFRSLAGSFAGAFQRRESDVVAPAEPDTAKPMPVAQKASAVAAAPKPVVAKPNTIAPIEDDGDDEAGTDDETRLGDTGEEMRVQLQTERAIARAASVPESRSTLWTNERRRYLSIAWPRGDNIANIREVLNRMEGDPILNDKAVTNGVTRFKLRRNERGLTRDGAVSEADRDLRRIDAMTSSVPAHPIDICAWSKRNGMILEGVDPENPVLDRDTLDMINHRRRHFELPPFRIDSDATPENFPAHNVGGEKGKNYSKPRKAA